jgi:radical SAM protein with 4Fe4S-binding SPASM domain
MRVIAPWNRPALERLHFDIVGGCQLKCVGCPNSTILPKVTRIRPAVFATCLANIDVRYVKLFRLFNYGEPLLHDDLPAIFDALATAARFRVRWLELSTNAQFARWDQIAEVMRRRLLNRLVVSCDGDGTPASYERFRPPGKWETLIEFLAKAKELRDRHDPALELMTRTVYFQPADMARWRGVLEPRGWKPEFRHWINLVGGAEEHSGRDWRPAQGVCSFVEEADQLFVDADGTVVPCCAHPRAGKFGNLCTEKWSEIVAGRARRDFVEMLREDRSAMDICGKCEFGPRDPKRSIGARIARFYSGAAPRLEGP